MKHSKQVIGLFGSIALMVAIPSTGFSECLDLCTLETNALITDTNSKLDNSNATLDDIQFEIDRTNFILDPLEALLISMDTNIDLIYKAMKPDEDNTLPIYSIMAANYYSAYLTQLDDVENIASSTTTISDEFIGGSDGDENQDKALSSTKKQKNVDYSSLSANSLFDGSEYSDEQATSASRYIKTLSGTALPTTVVDPGADDAVKMTNRNNTMAAVQSLSAYNLSSLTSKRIGAPEVKDPLGNVTTEGKPSSQATLDNIYETMVSEPTFLSDIATDTSMDVGKKSLYLLVGAFTALYRIEQNQQQLIATQSATNSMLILLAQVMAEMQPDAAMEGEEAEAGASMSTGVEGGGTNEGLAPVADEEDDDTDGS